MNTVVRAIEDYPRGPPPTLEVPPPNESLMLPAWTFLPCSFGGREEEESSRGKRTRVEDGDRDFSDEEKEDEKCYLMIRGEDYEEEPEKMEEETEEKEKEPEGEEEEEEEPMEIEDHQFKTPKEEDVKVTTEKSTRTPSPEVTFEDMQNLHPVDQAFYTDLYMHKGHLEARLAAMTWVPVVPESLEQVVLPEFPEDVLSSVRYDLHETYGKVPENPIWILSDSEDED